MIAFLDHDDFKKSRKAVFISSATLILASTVDFQSQSVAVGQLEVEMNGDRLRWLIALATYYFLIVFSVRAVGEVFARKRQSTEALLDRYISEMEEKNEWDNEEDMRTSLRQMKGAEFRRAAREFQRKKDETLSLWDRRFQITDSVGFWMIDILFTYAFALVSLISPQFLIS